MAQEANSFNAYTLNHIVHHDEMLVDRGELFPGRSVQTLNEMSSVGKTSHRWLRIFNPLLPSYIHPLQRLFIVILRRLISTVLEHFSQWRLGKYVTSQLSHSAIRCFHIKRQFDIDNLKQAVCKKVCLSLLFARTGLFHSLLDCTTKDILLLCHTRGGKSYNSNSTEVQNTKSK